VQSQFFDLSYKMLFPKLSVITKNWVRMTLIATPRGVAVRWSSRAAVSQLQVVDARLVNAHHCVIHAREDRQSMLTLRLVRRGLRLLGKGANYAQAERLFAQATACAQSGSGATSPAAWVASNAMGVRYDASWFACHSNHIYWYI
jgi:hypothetical protein